MSAMRDIKCFIAKTSPEDRPDKVYEDEDRMHIATLIVEAALILLKK